MKIEMDIQKIGAGMLATGTVFLNLVNQQVAWWIGVIFMVAGPILMGLKNSPINFKKKRRPNID
jgi:hypothetical protein